MYKSILLFNFDNNLTNLINVNDANIYLKKELEKIKSRKEQDKNYDVHVSVDKNRCIIDKIDYSFVKIDYFTNKAIKKTKIIDNENKYRVWSLLQKEILYNDIMITKFINFLMKDGKKYLAYKNFELALSFLKNYIPEHPLLILRKILYGHEQYFDYKLIRSKKSKKIIFIIPKFVYGKARWLKPLKLLVNEFFYDQSILHKSPFFRKYYRRLAFTFFRMYVKHDNLIEEILNNKVMLIAKNYKRLYDYFNKKKKQTYRYNKLDKDTKWNWTVGSNWEELKIDAIEKKNNEDIWDNRFFDFYNKQLENVGAVKIKPRKLKKRHMHTYFPWYGE